MSSSFFVSAAAVRNLKHAAERRVAGVSSAHLSEAVAAALGFKTNAALRAALKNAPTVEVPKPSNAKLAQRLRQLGYMPPGDLRVLPELAHSYSPFRNYPLRKQRSARWWAWRNLMVAAINCGIEQRLFGLSPEDNWWPGAGPESHQCEQFTYMLALDGNLPAVASVNAQSGDELSISIVVNPRDLSKVPQWYAGLDDGDATAHGWVERRLGAWIHDGGESFHSRRALQPRLSAMKIDPLGYSDQGSFIM